MRALKTHTHNPTFFAYKYYRQGSNDSINSTEIHHKYQYANERSNLQRGESVSSSLRTY